MNVNIDLGNVWEMLSAIGTIGAVIVSLYMSKKENNPIVKIDVNGINEDVQVTNVNSIFTKQDFLKVIIFEIKNYSNYEIEISSIQISFLNKKVNKLFRKMKFILSRIIVDEVFILLNNPELGVYAKLPMFIKAKSKDTYIYTANKFEKLIENRNSDKDILVMVKDSFGNYYYKYIEINYQRWKV